MILKTEYFTLKQEIINLKCKIIEKWIFYQSCFVA